MRIPPWLVALGALVFLAWPILLGPTTMLIGDPYSESMGHLWRLQMVMDGLWEHGPLVTASDRIAFPDGRVADFLDPVNLVFYAPLVWLSGSHGFAWNGLFLAWIATGAVGASMLARRVAPESRWAAPLLVTSTVLDAYWISHDYAGRTEYLPALLLPLHLAWLRDALLGDRPARVPAWIKAGVTLAGIALGGWYLAIFVLLFEVPLALAWAWRSERPRSRTLASLVAVAVVAILPVLPALDSFMSSGREMLDVVTARQLPPATRVGIPGVVSFFHELRIPSPPVLMHGLDQPAYPGVVALLVAVAGAFVGRGERRRAIVGWLLLTVWILVWATGYDLCLADETGRVTSRIPGLPRLLHELVPVTELMSGWNRLGCMVGVPAGVALVHGFSALVERWPRLVHTGWILVPLCFLDHATWPRPLELRPRTFDPSAPEGLVAVVAALPEGAVLPLPFDLPERPDELKGLPITHQHWILWHRELARPVTAKYGMLPDGTTRRSLLTETLLTVEEAEMRRASHGRQTSTHVRVLDDPDLPACIRSDITVLTGMGVKGVVVVDGLPRSEVVAALVTQWLGPPHMRVDRASGWDLTRFDDPFLDDCERLYPPG